MTQKQLVKIREADCIGCTKCIDVCPVDAILGSQKQLHTVIAQECIGCKLCIPPCPVDCIELIPLPDTQPRISPEYVKQRSQARKERLRIAGSEEKLVLASVLQRKDYIAAAIARVKAKSK